MNQQIGEKLYQQRKAAGFSQEELAEKIGVSRQAVSKWERGESSPDTENLIALAQLYEISIDELIMGENKPNPEGDKVDISPSGIHVVNKDGEQIDVSLKGIHVDTADTNVHIDKNGVNVTEHGHVFYDSSKPDTRVYKFFKKFPYPILTVIAYLLFGSLEICGGWGLGWLVFLTIPLYYTLVTAIARKKASEFAYPVLVVIVYLYTGFVYSFWHPGWIMFLTIPVYYFLSEFIEKLCKR